MLINEEYNKRDYDLHKDRSAENLLAELMAGGMNKEEMNYVSFKKIFTYLFYDGTLFNSVQTVITLEFYLSGWVTYHVMSTFGKVNFPIALVVSPRLEVRFLGDLFH